MLNPDWMKVAESEIGVCAFAQGASKERITQYHENTNIHGYDDKAAWCSSFLNWVFNQVGISGTDSALARSWLQWGVSLTEPRPGCVVVLERNDPAGWQGHVGFFIRVDGDNIYLLGGNQLDSVCQHHYPLCSVLDFRWPSDHDTS